MSSSASAVSPGIVRGAYPERSEPTLSTLDRLGERLAGEFTRRWLRRRGRWQSLPGRVAACEANLGDDLAQEAGRLRRRLREERLGDDAVAESFALVRRAADETLGQRHYDVQLMGGFVLLQGMVAEMATGEGKTLTATLPAASAALAGMPVHVITVNDYLARRDAEAMGPVYRALGLSVGVVVSGLDPAARRAAYARDVTYCSNKEVAFDYLKDRIALEGRPSALRLAVEQLSDRPGRSERLLHRGLHFALVDEADSVLIDEARTPLIISGGNEGDAIEEETYRVAVELASTLERGRDFVLDERERAIRLREPGSQRVEERAEPKGGLWSGRRRRDELVSQALSALHLYQRDKHYLVTDDKVQIIDEYTGRVMPDRSWERGLHQMIEVKEGVTPSGRHDTLARMSYQRFFGRYLRLSGMTGTAREVSRELWATYRLPVVPLPTNRPLRRVDGGERVLPTEAEKWRAVSERIAELHREDRPVLVGTRSVAASETLSAELERSDLPHQVLNARQDRSEAEIVAQAGEAGRITVATNMAGRGTDILLGEGVAERGGLHVLATERHESRRIDRQLSGRCGRQGDPGSFEAIVSLEDELLQVYGGTAERQLVRAAQRFPGAAHIVLAAALRRCQQRAGRLHARMRRELMKRDSKLETLLAFSGKAE